MKDKKVYVLVLGQEPSFVGVYNDYRRAIELLLSEYATFLSSSEFNGKMVAYDLEHLIDEGSIPDVGRIYERRIES